MNGEPHTTDCSNNKFELVAIPKHFFYKLQLELTDYCVNDVTDIAHK